MQIGSMYSHIAYKKARNRVNKIVAKTKVEYYLKNITQNRLNPKEFWKNVNQLRENGLKATTITIVLREISKELEIAD